MKTHGHDIETFPSQARAIVFETNEDGSPHRLDFFVDDVIVGRQYQDADGQLESLHHIRDNKLHGPWYEVREGALSFITHYVEGLEHGVATQYLPDGEILGRYQVERGTGVDLWYSYSTGHLCEERELRDGARHGVERWWNPDGSGTVWQERHFRDGTRNGVCRKWDDSALLEDFPRFFVDGGEVSLDGYREASANDEALPVYRPADDAPDRDLLPSTKAMLNELGD